jgi:hypothetical protein
MVGALYYCIAVARCGLCGFEIEDGDLVVVGKFPICACNLCDGMLTLRRDRC